MLLPDTDSQMEKRQAGLLFEPILLRGEAEQVQAPLPSS